MQAKEELLEQLGETYGYVNELVEKKIEFFKLSFAEISAKAASTLILGLIIASLGLLTLTFALVSLGFWLTNAFDSGTYGFGTVALILFVMMILVMVLRRALIVKPTVNKILDEFFADDDETENR